MRTVDDIINAYDLFEKKAELAVVSVCEAEHSPLWTGHLPDDGEFIEFIGAEKLKQRQETRCFYRINGAIYIVNCERFKTERFLYQKGSFAYIMPQIRSVDIDTIIDFKLAEVLMNERMETTRND